MMNVLKAIDDAINSVLIPNGGAYVESMNEARAVIAELIEADRAYDKSSREWDDGRFSDWDGISDESRMKICADFEESALRRADAIARATQGAPTNGK